MSKSYHIFLVMARRNSAILQKYGDLQENSCGFFCDLPNLVIGRLSARGMT
jgi:hypothetical protein